jgi:hypothetical protein
MSGTITRLPAAVSGLMNFRHRKAFIKLLSLFSEGSPL